MAGAFLVAKLCDFDARARRGDPARARLDRRRGRARLSRRAPSHAHSARSGATPLRSLPRRRGAPGAPRRAARVGSLRDEEVLLELLGALPVERPADAFVREQRRRVDRGPAAARAAPPERAAAEGPRGRARSGTPPPRRRCVSFRVKPSRDRRATKFARRAVEDAKRDVSSCGAGRCDERGGAARPAHRLQAPPLHRRGLRHGAPRRSRLDGAASGALPEPPRATARRGRRDRVVQSAPSLLDAGARTCSPSSSASGASAPRPFARSSAAATSRRPSRSGGRCPGETRDFGVSSAARGWRPRRSRVAEREPLT